MLSHLIDGNNRRCLSDEKKECKDQKKLEMCREKSMPEQERNLGMG